MTRLADLPDEILHIIFPYLDCRDFLSFCLINKNCYQSYRDEPLYWRHHALHVLQLPPHYRNKFDPSSWRRMCEIYHRRARVLIWGSPLRPHIHYPQLVAHLRDRLEWPTEVRPYDDSLRTGKVVDIQCVVWTRICHTIMLNTAGRLVVAAPPEMDAPYRRLVPHTFENFQPLTFPERPWLPGAESLYSIRQFSACEDKTRQSAHILGLSIGGHLWIWSHVHRPAQYMTLGMNHAGPDFNPLDITRVAVSPKYAAAYITGRGLCFWDMERNSDSGILASRVFVSPTILPGTSYSCKSHVRNQLDSSEDSESIGEIRAFVVLSCALLIFYTHLNKVFGVSLKQQDRVNGQPLSPIEISAFSSLEPEGTTITGLAGTNHAFGDQSFTIFTSAGAVLTVPISQGWEYEVMQVLDISKLKPGSIPALQPQQAFLETGETDHSQPPTHPTSTVVTTSGGSSHTLALTAHGRIIVTGEDLSTSSSLGLGNPSACALWRGLRPTLRNNRPTGSSDLLPIANETPHHIYFHPSQRAWLDHLNASANQPSGRSRAAMLHTSDILLGEFSEWVEQELLAWEDHPRIRALDPEGLGCYFVASVSSARYHGAAVVLVNDPLIQEVEKLHLMGGAKDDPAMRKTKEKESHPRDSNPVHWMYNHKWRWDDDVFPRVDLPSSIMHGDDDEPLQDWKYGKPSAREVWNAWG